MHYNSGCVRRLILLNLKSKLHVNLYIEMICLPPTARLHRRTYHDIRAGA